MPRESGWKDAQENTRRLEKRIVALEESEKLFRSFFEKCADGILIHDPDGRIMDVNPQALEIFGHEREVMEITGTKNYCVNVPLRTIFECSCISLYLFE